MTHNNKYFHKDISSIFPLLIIMGIMLKDILESQRLSVLTYAVIGVGFTGSIISCLIRGDLSNTLKIIPKDILAMMIPTFIICNVVSIYYLGRFNTSPFFISFFIGVVILLGGTQYVIKFIFILPFINLILQIYETVTASVLFETYSKLDDIYLGADEWTIGDGGMRTKGIFQGPLHVVSVSLIALINKPQSTLLHVVLMLAAYLGAARLGLVIGITLFIIHIGSKQGRYNISLIRLAMITWKIIPFLLILYSIVVFANILNLDRLSFIGLAFDFEKNESNTERVVVWLKSIEMYLSYDAIYMIFGKYDEIKKGYLNGTESDWLRLLVDNGFFCFIIYVLSFYHFIKKIKIYKATIRKNYIFILIFAMNLYPCLGWLGCATAYWVTFFSFHQNLQTQLN